MVVYASGWRYTIGMTWKQLVGCKKCSRTYLVDPDNPPATCPDCDTGPFYKWADRVKIDRDLESVLVTTAFKEYREKRQEQMLSPNEGGTE